MMKAELKSAGYNVELYLNDRHICDIDIADLERDFVEEHCSLEICELWQDENYHISSEDGLSEYFDSMVNECYSAENKLQLKNDSIMVNEAFSCYADSLCKDGRLFTQQYNEYSYVGEYK